MDPNILNASADAVRQEVKIILDAFGSGSGHVFNLGHGIQPTANADNVTILLEAVHQYSQA
jgi:uroporphyrinogen decarboxylase